MARVTKKDIYASYGIEYDTESEKILSPIGYVPALLIDGNEKIGKGVWHFSTLPTNNYFDVTVNGVAYHIKGTCCCCCDGCYATKGNYRYQDTKDSLAMRTIIARDYMEFCEKAINAQIAANNIHTIRIHASGDFFSTEYAAMWARIATNNPGVIMWTYTKSPDCQTAFDGISNAHIVPSCIPGKGFNFGHCDYVIATYEYLKAAGKKVYICRCGIDKNQHCVNCKGCFENEYVLFVEHSTGYKAEKDPLFPIVKALIDAQ